MTTRELIKRADEYKKKLEQKRELEEDKVKTLLEYFKITVTFSSNSMEGNSLSLGDNRILLEDQLSVGGKLLKDCYEATGHALAYDYMIEMAKKEELDITEELIKRLHFLFYHRINVEEAGRYRTIPVIIPPTEEMAPEPVEVPYLMEHYINQMKSSINNLHPIEFAAFSYNRFIDIQPFTAGNGQTARLLLNLILMHFGYGIITFPLMRRDDYHKAYLSSKRIYNPNIDKMIRFIAECVLEGEENFCRLLHI